MFNYCCTLLYKKDIWYTKLTFGVFPPSCKVIFEPFNTYLCYCSRQTINEACVDFMTDILKFIGVKRLTFNTKLSEQKVYFYII